MSRARHAAGRVLPRDGDRWNIRVGGRALTIEAAWVGVSDPGAPVIVFLHEGLGSVAAWRDFPDRLCAAAGARGLVYSRPGYGRSSRREPDAGLALDFHETEAAEVLPAVAAAAGIDEAPWLFGHSDGATIALVHAARLPGRAAGVIALAPFVFVEDVTVDGVRAARERYGEGDLRERLARLHDDVDGVFFGWSDAWLRPDFRSWSIESLIPAITCPVLAVQGTDDEYATAAQLDRIGALVPSATLVALGGCGHHPHRDRPEAVIAATVELMSRVSSGAGSGSAHGPA